MSLETLGSTLTSLVGSFVASFIAIDALYQISNQTELWIAVILVIDIYLVVATQFMQQIMMPTQRGHEPEMEHVVLLKLMGFLHMTAILILIRLVVDLFRYALAVTPMAWDDYINFFNIMLFIVFVSIQRAQYLFGGPSREH